MEKLRSYQVRFSEYLEKKNVVTDFLSVCETRSGISKLYLAYGVIVFLTLYLVIGYGTDILTLLVGALYPAYQSHRNSRERRRYKMANLLGCFCFCSTFRSLYSNDGLLLTVISHNKMCFSNLLHDSYFTKWILAYISTLDSTVRS
ncbi:unnamed protein product [Schistosoma margrebowiei]|uniref:Receptor expression-enhancing protein n=1 Tax=Schistosoma margrebowiei TaxID=48269 RepID=A0AA85AND3_9TREM|nr:unnamed protein product [Schistosoma margrebowiei]